MQAAIAHVTIDIDLSTAPIEGSLTGSDGIVRRFAGYMQLVTVLEAALRAARGERDRMGGLETLEHDGV